MRFGRLIALAAMLAMGTTAAQAASTTYTLQYVQYDNAFAPNYRVGGIGVGSYAGVLAGTCVSCAGQAGPVSTAVEDGFGNVNITGVNWTANAFGNNYSNSWNATTVLGTGVTLTKSGNSCSQVLGTFCTANKSGFGGNTWYTGFGQDGTTPVAQALTNVTVVGDYLFVTHRMQLSETNPTGQSYTLAYSSVPVPAAAWLFGSAVGLMGFARRRLAA